MKRHVFLGFVLCLSACSQNELPPAPAKPNKDVKIEKTLCETAGPMTIVPDADGLYPMVEIPPRGDRFCAILLPIDAKSIAKLSSGKKIYEYRRSLPSDKISHVAFFNNQTLAIEAIAEVVESIAGPPQELALSTWLQSGEKLDDVIGYFAERSFGFALSLKGFQALQLPISLQQARTLDSKFQRPYGYLFLDRYPALEAEVLRQLSVVKVEPSTPVPSMHDASTPDSSFVDGWL